MRKLDAGIRIGLLVAAMVGLFACKGSASPWPDVRSYTEPTKQISVKVGQSFAVSMDIGNNLFPVMSEAHDETILERLGGWENLPSPDVSDAQVKGRAWALFKALQPGSTQIKITHRGHITMDFIGEVTYSVVVK